ncbi:hypothetical protein EMPS_07757 [Entomortierella parvispora]|uniref:PQ-loop-domain-containing protein n=1 Tax=Entomortierella parvispora TaxID=205924 RepID=A0A9P3LYN2_9FUNG|nr:hypothetical protein EMPS_07757 [Entomortierella parvispora]
MPSRKYILENVFGMLGIVFWSFQLLPQIIDNYKARTTKGLSLTMFVIWTLAALGFGCYSIVEELSIPIILQPHIFGLLSLIVCLQCFYYGQGKGQQQDDFGDGQTQGLGEAQEVHGWSVTSWKRGTFGHSLKRTVLLGLPSFLVLAGIEVGAVFGTKAGIAHNVKGTLSASGIIPVVLLGLGFLPQYVDIFHHRSVVGVSMVFITGDALGSIFSLISLAFREIFDLLAAMNYVIVLVCDLIVVGFFIWFNKNHPELKREPGKDRVLDEIDPSTPAGNPMVDSGLETSITVTSQTTYIDNCARGDPGHKRSFGQTAKDEEQQSEVPPTTIISQTLLSTQPVAIYL